MYKFNLFIKNAKSTGNFRQILSPYNSRVVGEVEIPDSAAVEKAFVNAEEMYKKVMLNMPAYQRAEILYKVSNLIKENTEELAQLIAAEGGKPVKDARVEVIRASNTVKMSGDTALTLNGTQLTMDRAKGSENHIAFTIKQPIGTVLAISAFNHPVNLICHQVATSFAAGNTVLVKPASQTPLSCFKIAEYFRLAGLEDGIISVIPISGSETDKIVSDKRIRFITFIGSGEVGWNIKKKVHPGCGIALEHGGTAVAVIDKSADLQKALPSVIKGGFYHAGQVCVSTQNVFIHESIFESAKTTLVELAKKLKTGDPNDDLTDVGPIINQSEHKRVIDWVNSAIESGANVELGGKAMPNQCIEPTILSNTNYDMLVMNSEIFGPVINLNPYNDLDKLIEDCNNTPFMFQNAIYAKDIDVALHFARKVDSKAVIINDSTAFRVDWMPFGGSKESGYSIGGVQYSIEDVVEEKLIVIKNEFFV